MLKCIAFCDVKFRIKWFHNTYLLSKISTIRETAFILVEFPAGSRVNMNFVILKLLRKLWIIQMIRQLCIYCFLNKVNVGCFILNIWCIENSHKRMDI